MNCFEIFHSVCVVLVEPQSPGNIGATARAMKTMGLSELRLVNPRVYPHEEATWRATNAQDVLNNAVVFEDVSSAIADCEWVIGTSSRSRTLAWPSIDAETFAKRWHEEFRYHKTAIMFGREDIGLSNQDLQRCNYHLVIPANPDYCSLNLASAVQIICYELFKIAQNDLQNNIVDNIKLSAKKLPHDQLANQEELSGFLMHLEETLIKLEFHNPENPRQLLPRIQRLFLRAELDKMDVNIWRGILTSIQQKLSQNKP